MRSEAVNSYMRYHSTETIAIHRILNFKKTDWTKVDPRFDLSKQDAFEIMFDQLAELLDSTEKVQRLMRENGLTRSVVALEKRRIKGAA